MAYQINEYLKVQVGRLTANGVKADNPASGGTNMGNIVSKNCQGINRLEKHTLKEFLGGYDYDSGYYYF